jgi:hypothetical protein
MLSSEEELLKMLQDLPSEKAAAPEKPPPESGVPVSLQNLFTHHDTHPIVLDYALLREFGLNWLLWEPETIWSEVQTAFKTPVSELSRAKIHTLKTIHISELPWRKWQVFEKIIQGLNNNIPRWEYMQAPGIEQLYAGVDILDSLRHVPFEPEVRLYMAAAVLNDDIIYVPPPLDFLQLEVSQPYYHCKDCGNEDSALFSDGTCDTCTQKFSPEQGLSMQPKLELVQAGRGKNVELRLKFDPDEVERRWKEVEKDESKFKMEENGTDIQVAKLLAAREYMNKRRAQLAEQLTSLKSWLSTQ